VVEFIFFFKITQRNKGGNDFSANQAESDASGGPQAKSFTVYRRRAHILYFFHFLFKKKNMSKYSLCGQLTLGQGCVGWAHAPAAIAALSRASWKNKNFLLFPFH
jgi:hypothetical protein